VGTPEAGAADAISSVRNGYGRQWQAVVPMAVWLVTLVLSMGASPVL
jgi:hypothetical protein